MDVEYYDVDDWIRTWPKWERDAAFVILAKELSAVPDNGRATQEGGGDGD